MKIYNAALKRLEFYQEVADSIYWDKFWKNKNRQTRGLAHPVIMEYMQKYLRRGDKVIEGGCGNGSKVRSMQQHGYDVYGVDYAKKTVKRLNKEYPNLKISVQDVRNLKFPNNYFSGYWSFGVIEHFQEGYGHIMQEMYRVLDKGGYLFLIFPHMSLLRKLKGSLGLYKRKKPGNLEFYQYALNSTDVKRRFRRQGFSFIEQRSQSGLKGMKDEIKALKPIGQALYDYKGRSIIIRGIRFALDNVLSYFCGHSIMLVFKK